MDGNIFKLSMKKRRNVQKSRNHTVYLDRISDPESVEINLEKDEDFVIIDNPPLRDGNDQYLTKKQDPGKDDTTPEQNLIGMFHSFKQNERIFPKKGDVKEKDIEGRAAYQKSLMENTCQTKLMRELMYISIHNLPQRLSMLYEHLQRESIALHTLRGLEYGETALHVAILHGSVEVVDILIERGRDELILAPYSSPEYRGTTALHLAIMQGQRHTIHRLIGFLSSEKRNKFLHTEATSTVFMEKFQSHLPLSLAAWCGDIIIFEDLLMYGAELDKTESNMGNTVFHTLVEQSLRSFRCAYKTYKDIESSLVVRKYVLKRAEECNIDPVNFWANLLKKKNEMGFSPLSLSCRLGAIGMFDTIMQTKYVYKFPIWQYGPCRQNQYDVTELDTIPNGDSKENMMSILEMLVYTTNDIKLPVFALEPVATLIHLKWKAYRKYFWSLAFFHVVFMVSLTMTAVRNPLWTIVNETAINISFPSNNEFTNNLNLWIGGRNVIVLCLECFILLGTILSIIMELKDITFGILAVIKCHRSSLHIHEAYSLRWHTLLKLNLFRPTNFLISILVLIWFALRIQRSPAADSLLVPTLIIGWSFTLYFTRAFQNIGVFNKMLVRVLVYDVLPCGVTFIVIMIGFTASFNVLTTTSGGSQGPKHVTTFLLTIWTLIRQSVGLNDMDEYLEDLPSGSQKVSTRLLLLLFIVVVIIGLMSMLIAAMGNTFTEVTHKHPMLWAKMKADTSLMLERRLPACLRPQLPLSQCVMNDSSTWLLEVKSNQTV